MLIFIKKKIIKTKRICQIKLLKTTYGGMFSVFL